MFVILILTMAIARFERVSTAQFSRDLDDLLGISDDCSGQIKLPVRATSGSAGYDFYSPVTVTLKPGQTAKIPTGIRCSIDNGYVLELYPRSSLGFRYQLSLLNTVGIIDSDYYNADNEGHIIVGLINRGDKELTINAGDRFVQGVFLPYGLAMEEENSGERHGGFGSTD